jgi:hypothetical protein
MLIGPYLNPPKPTPAAAFQRCIGYFRAKSAFAVDLTSDANAVDGSIHSSATVVRRSPSWASIEIRSDANQYIGPLDWLYQLKAGRLTVYDVKRGAYESQKTVKQGDALMLLAEPVGKAMPEAAADIVSPDQLAAFFDRFSPLTDWKRTTSRGSDHWLHKGSSGSVAFDFEPATGRISGYRIEARSSTMTWRFHYRTVGQTPPFALPTSAVHLLALRLPPPRPHYSDRDVQHAVDRSFDAYGRTLHLHVTVRESGTVDEIWRNGDAVAQVSPAGGWSWGAGQLTAWIPGKGIYKGKCSMEAITQYLSYFRLPVEPMVHDFILDSNFAAKLFTPEFGVKEVGSMTVKGTHLTLLDMTSSQVKISVGMNDVGLITTLDSSTVDGAGRVASQTSRQFTYEPVKAWPKAPAGPTRPLPTIKLS